MFRRRQREARRLDLMRDIRHAREIVAATFAVRHPEILQPELLQAIFSGVERLLVMLDLVVEEADGGTRVLTLVAQARLDEDRHQRLDDLARLLGIGVAIGDQVQILPRAAGELDRAGHRFDQLVTATVARDAQVEVRHPHDLLDVRPADEGPADEPHLLIDIRRDRQAGEQRLQQRLGVDEDARAGFESFWNAVHHGHAHERCDPCSHQADPPAVPHLAKLPPDLLQRFVHRLLLDTAASSTRSTERIRTSSGE